MVEGQGRALGATEALGNAEAPGLLDGLPDGDGYGEAEVEAEAEAEEL